MKRTVPALQMLALCLLVTVKVSLAQTYLNATGDPSFGVNIPVENGFINVTNGNLHLEFPLATHTQRGALRLNERLVYDSRIWAIVQYDNYYWWPTNIPNTSYAQGGWRFVTGAETGTLSSTTTQMSNRISCTPSDPVQGMHYYNTEYKTIYTWADPSGTSHPFDIYWHTITNICDTLSPQPESGTGWALDGSGYQITLSGDDQDAPTSISITDSNGTQVYPQVVDRYGNYWSLDSNQNLIDDVGRTPVIVTTNGNTTYYDVLAPNGPINNSGTRVRYTVTTSPVQVSTNFNQPVSGSVAEWSGTLNPVQSIGLPDGSSYGFTYDTYGEIASVTLPTGGVINYGWSNYLDSYQNVNRWLTQRTAGSDPSMTFIPSVISQCSSGGTGCQEQVTFHEPSADETVYQLTLNNGAWNTNVTSYSGLASSGTPLVNVVNTYDFSHTCTSGACAGAEYIKKATATTTLLDNGLTTQTQYLYGNPQLGKLTGLLQWDYYTGTPSTTPNRETDNVYTGLDLTQTTLLNNGVQASQTSYVYTSSATPTSGVPQHGTPTGPYLHTVSQWLNTGSPLTTTYTMNDTGMVTGVADPNGNPPSSISYQCSNALPYQVANPLGQTTTYGYDCDSGAVASVQDPNDSAASRVGTVYQYEATAGRLQSINYPDGGQTSYSYPSATEVDTSILATPNPTISSQAIVDSFGRSYRQIQAGVSTETTYDANGRVYCVTNPHFVSSSSSTDGRACVISYDGMDRPLVLQQPDGNTLQSSYSGNSTTSKDEAGNQWVRTSNAFGLLTNVVEPTGASTNYTYDGLGNLSAVNQLGVSGETPRSRGFAYDSVSRLRSATSPEAGTVTYTYNGNVQTKTAPAQNSAPGSGQTVTTTYTYDALNRLTSKTYSDGNWPAHFGYDGFDESGVYRVPGATNPIGRLTRVFNGGDSYQGFGYDAVGRLIEQSDCLPSNCNEQANEVHASYDLAGTLTSLTYPDGRVVTQDTDAAGNLQNVIFDNWSGQHVGYTYASGFTYTPAGSQAEVTYGNGVYIHTPYNNRQQMCQVWSQNSIQPLIDTHIYYGGSTIYCNSTPGNNGNITQVKDWRNPNQTRYFGYDNLNRINSFSNGDGSMQQSYSYDSFGNLSQSGTLNSQVGFDSNNHINNGGYAYDAAGNVSSFNNGAFTTSYWYNAENALINFNNGTAGYITTGDGKRIRKDAAGSWTEYVYFGDQLLAEKNTDGSWSDYIYANGQLIARADSFDARIHVHGTTPGGKTASWAIAGGAGYVIKPNDKLFLRQYQYNGYGGPNVSFTDGTQTYGAVFDSAGQAICADQIEQQWIDRTIDLSAYAGKTVNNYQVVTDYSSPTGTYDLYYGDIAILSSDGTVTPIYTRQTGTAIPNGYNEGQTNLSAIEEVSNQTGDSVQGPTTTTYYVGDQIGSTRMLASAGGWPMSSTTFYPFGQEQSPATDTNHYRFTGLERDSESGLDHATFRQYSSSMGRWMSPDPYDGSMDIQYPQTLNRYVYVGNNPLEYTDPTGLDPISDIYTISVYVFGAGGEVDPLQDILAGALLGVDAVASLFSGGLFAHPQFRGSLKPRPSAPNSGCPSVPAHPPGTSIQANMDSVQHSVLSDTNWLQRAKTWAWNVHNYNAPWSYQRLGEVTGQGNLYDDFGNFNYGATGTALGLPKVVLQGAAGIAKWFNYAANKPPQLNPFWSQPWTNDPHKVAMIKQGIQYAANGCKNN